MAEEEGSGGCGGADSGGGGGGGSDDTSPSVSPTSRAKFFCSYGGKILPRPSDGLLKYVGGDTRVVAVARTISFSELMKRMGDLFEGDFVLKYQIAPEDLDSLVSVKSDEDLRHMLDEYDRLESEGNSKLRTFLFPSKPTIIESGQNPFSNLVPDQSPEQRFVDAINGVVRMTKPPLSSTSRLKSVSTSPESASPHSLSPTSCAAPNPHNNSSELFVNCLQSRLSSMHKVHSSPTLCSPHNCNTTQMGNNQLQYPCNYCHGHQHQQYYHGGYLQGPYRPPPDHHLVHQPLHPMVQPEYGKAATGCSGHVSPVNVGYNNPFNRRYPGSGGQNKWGHLGDYAAAADATYGAWHLSRDRSLPRSERDQSKDVAWE
ncbi:hypothetical protein Dimus_013697 [Dionaea muscipula]